jgi:hypothetical protein
MNERSAKPRPDAAQAQQTGRLLEEWLQDEAPAHEPPVLVPTVRARVALTRRRPGWLVRDWWLWQPERSRKGFRGMNPLTQFIAVAVLALSGAGMLFVATETGQGPTVQPGAQSPSEVVAAVTGTTTGFDATAAEQATKREDGTIEAHGLRLGGTLELSDPRLSGEVWSVHDYRDFNGYSSGARVTSATMGIDNDGGSWAGTIRGYEVPGNDDWHAVIDLTGSGGYEGLSAMLMMLDQGSYWDIQGMVYPGEPLPYPEAE